MLTGPFNCLFHPTYIPPSDWAKIHLLFWDSISRIVPSNMQDQFGDDYIKTQFGVEPSVFPMINPNSSDIFEFDKYRSLFEAACLQIKNSRTNERSSVEQFGVNPSKAPGWIFDFLQQHGLASESMSTDGDRWQIPHYMVDKEAGYLILNLLSSIIAERRAIHQITNNQSAFFVSAAKGISGSELDRPDTSMEGALAMAVFRIMVPKNIDNLTFSQVMEIRKQYTDLRNTFHHTVRRLSVENNLEGIVDRKYASEAIQGCVSEFQVQERKFNKGKFARFFGDWKVQSVGTIMGGIGAAIAGGPAVGIVVTLGGATVAILNSVLNKNTEDEFHNSIRYIHLLNRTLNPLLSLKQLQKYLPGNK